MKLMTKAIEKKIPRLLETDGEGDNARVYLKLFHPMLRWTWYATEYDPDTKMCFGYVLSGIDPSYDELGSFSLEELEQVSLPFGLKIERDLYWDDKTRVGDVMRGKL